MLRNAERDGVTLTDPPPPQDVHPTAYAQTVANRAFPGAQASNGNAPAPFEGGAAGPSSDESQPVVNGRDLAAPPLSAQVAPATSESAFRNGGGPPPLQMTSDVRGAAPRPPPTFAPMDMDSRDRSTAPGRPAASISGRSAAEDEERHPAERALGSGSLHGRHEASYRPGSSSSAQQDWNRERSDRAISNYHPSPRVSPTASRAHAQYVSRPTLDSRSETSPRSVRRSPAYDYSRHGSTGVVDVRHAQMPQRQSGDRLSAREIEDRARGTSASRFSEGGYDAERMRMDDRRRADFPEQSRSRAEEAKPMSISNSGSSRATEDMRKSSRATSPVRPMSSHSRPGSSRRKKKSAKATSAAEKLEREAELARQAEQEAKKALPPKPVSPPRSRVIDEGQCLAIRVHPTVADSHLTDYDEGAADALMGLAGYRGSGQGKESTYTPVLPLPVRSPVVSRLNPQSNNSVISSSSSGLKRPTASSPSREETESREKKARYESPPRDPAPLSNLDVSPARSAPKAVSVPPRAVTTMIEVLNPSRATPTRASHMTANELVSPSQRVKGEDTPSPGRRSVVSPELTRATAKDNPENAAVVKNSESVQSVETAKESLPADSVSARESVDRPESIVSKLSPDVEKRQTSSSPTNAASASAPVVSIGDASLEAAGEQKTESTQEAAAVDVKASRSASEEKEKALGDHAGGSAGPMEKEGEAMDTTS